MTKTPQRRGRSHLRGGQNKNKGIGVENIRWSAVILTGVVLLALLFGLVFGIRACAVRKGKDNPAVPMATQPQESAGSDAVVSQKTPQESDAAGQPGSSIDNPIDLSDGIIEIQSKEKSINTPDVFGHEMVYSAGTGSLLEPLL